MMLKFLRSKKAFTLVELMIVVAIVGILAGIAIPRYMNFIRRSHEASTKGNLGAIRSALNIYYSDLDGIFPARGTAGVNQVDCGIRIGPFIGTGATNYLDSLPIVTEDCGNSAHKTNGASPVQTQGVATYAGLGAVDGGWSYHANATASTVAARVIVDCGLADSKTTIINTW